MNVNKSKIEIDITHDHKWVERIAKTANEIWNEAE